MTNKQRDFFRALLLRRKEELLDSSRSAFKEMMAHDQKPSDEGDYAVEEVNQYLTCTIQTRDRKCLLEIEKAFARMAAGFDFANIDMILVYDILIKELEKKIDELPVIDRTGSPIGLLDVQDLLRAGLAV